MYKEEMTVYSNKYADRSDGKLTAGKQLSVQEESGIG